MTGLDCLMNEIKDRREMYITGMEIALINGQNNEYLMHSSKFQLCDALLEYAEKLQSEEALKQKDIENLHAEIDKLNQQKTRENAANELKLLFDSYVNAGFTRFEALQLVSTMLSSAVKKR